MCVCVFSSIYDFKMELFRFLHYFAVSIYSEYSCMNSHSEKKIDNFITVRKWMENALEIFEELNSIIEYNVSPYLNS